ncbi:MAG: glycosyltransferase family 39 protein [Nitrososphaerales archaeon]
MALHGEQPALASQDGVSRGQGAGSAHWNNLEFWRLLSGLPVAMVVGLLLRVLLIGAKSLWLDEAYTLWVARAGLAAWVGGAPEPFYPPLYYAFLQYWIQLGQSESILRLSSALFGVLAIPAAFLLARSLKGTGVARSAAWLVALAPLLVWYSQEFRGYSMLVFLGLLSSLAFVRLLLHPKGLALVGWWLLYVVATAAALYTHYDAVLVLPIQLSLLLVLSAQRRMSAFGLGAVLVAWPAIIAVYWPWLNSPAARGFLTAMSLTGAEPGVLLGQALGVSLRAASLVSIAFGVVLVSILAGAWLFTCSRDVWPAIYRSRAVRAALVVAFIMLLILSVWPRGYSFKRHLVIFVPFICLVVAWFWPWAGRFSRTLAALLLLSAIASLVNVIAIPKDDWKAAAGFLQAAYQEGDAIWIAPGYDSVPFEYYNRSRLPVVEINDPQPGSDALPLPRGRIWLVYNKAPTMLVDAGPKLEAELARRLDRAQEWSAYRIRVVLFVPQ